MLGLPFTFVRRTSAMKIRLPRVLASGPVSVRGEKVSDRAVLGTDDRALSDPIMPRQEQRAGRRLGAAAAPALSNRKRPGPVTLAHSSSLHLAPGYTPGISS